MPRLLGLDIDKNRLKISCADIRFWKVSFLKSEEIHLTGDIEGRNKIMAESLAQLKSSLNPDGVILGLPLQNFSCSMIQMPFMNRDDLSRALQFELEKYLPLPVDDYIHDFLTFNTESALNAFVLSVKKETVLGLIKLVTDVGLKVVSVRCRAIDVLSRLFDLLNEKNLKGVFVLTVDDGYEICRIEGSMPVLLRKVDRDGLPVEIERMLGDSGGKVFFSGEIDQLTAERFIGQKLQINIAESLIYGHFKKRRLYLNFIPPEMLPPVRDLYPYLTYGFAAATFVFYVMTGLVSYYKDTSTLSRIESRLEKIKSGSSAKIEIRKKLDDLIEDRKSLLEFMSSSNRVTGIVWDLSASLPKDTWLMSLTVDDKNVIEMEGFSKKTSDLIIALEKTGKFSNISFASPIISKDGEERFSLKLEGKAK